MPVSYKQTWDLKEWTVRRPDRLLNASLGARLASKFRKERWPLCTFTEGAEIRREAEDLHSLPLMAG